MANLGFNVNVNDTAEITAEALNRCRLVGTA